MHVLPKTAWALLALSTVIAGVTLLAAAGKGADKHLVGFQVPYIRRSRATWVAGHRAARWVVLPACLCSAILAVIAFDDAQAALVPVGWAIWLVGLLTGALIASITARQTERG